MTMSKDKEFFDGLLSSALQQRSLDYSEYIEGLEIPLEPVGGDRVIGELLVDERATYINMIAIDTRLEDVFEDIQKEANVDLAEHLIASGGEVSDDFANVLMAGNVSAELADEYFYLLSLQAFVSGKFWFDLRSRLQTFATRLDIRAGYRVVNLGLKFQPK